MNSDPMQPVINDRFSRTSRAAWDSYSDKAGVDGFGDALGAAHSVQLGLDVDNVKIDHPLAAVQYTGYFPGTFSFLDPVEHFRFFFRQPAGRFGWGA